LASIPETQSRKDEAIPVGAKIAASMGYLPNTVAAKSDATPKKGRCHQFSSFSVILSHKTDFQTGFLNRMVARHIQGHSVILF
jgi:hypothetical protein